MISRVFAHLDLPCFGRFSAPDGDEVRASILLIARRKAVLDCHLPLDPGSVLSLSVDLPDGSTVPLMARVSGSGERGLFLEFQHASNAEDARFGSRLITACEEFTTSEAARQLEARSEIRDSILKRTRTMRSSDLAERRSEVRVLDMRTITSLIETSLEETLALSEHSFDAAARRRLLKETEESFQARLAVLQAEKAGAEEQITQLRAELERAQSTLAEERVREIEDDQFTVSAAGIVEIEERLGRMIERGLQSGDVDAQTEEAMRQVVSRLLDDEREKIGERAREAQSDAIGLLERKVQRLSQTLEKSQKAREIAEHRARALEAAGGGTALAGVMEAGLHPDDPTRDAKLALLKEIVKENDTVRAHIQKSKVGALPAAAPSSSAEEGGVRKIAVKRVKPPPLTRSS